MDYKVMDPKVAKQLMKDQAKPNDAAVRLAEGDGTPYPALDGKRVMNTGTGEVFFIWNGGLRSWVPDPDTYNLIFANWDGILGMTDDNIGLIQRGDNLNYGSGIFTDGSGPEYLVTLSHKYWIVDPNVKSYCDFANAAGVPSAVLAAVPAGPFNIDYGA